MDVINIEVLPDGTIKMVTDRVSMANHISAEGFLRQANALLGGKSEQKKRVHLGMSLKSHMGEHEHTHEDGTVHQH